MMCPEPAPKGKMTPKRRVLSGSQQQSNSGDATNVGGKSSGSQQTSAGGVGSVAHSAVGGKSSGSQQVSASSSFDTSASASASSLSGGCVFNTPSGLDVDDVHQLVYVVDSGNNAVRRVDIDPSANYNIETVVIDPLLNMPHGVVVIPSQQVIYVTSFGSHCVFKFDVSGVSFPVSATVSNIYAGSTSGVFGHVDGSLSTSVFMNPTGITADANNNLYLNEWYMVPGEVDLGSAWASEYGVSTGETEVDKGSESNGSGKNMGSDSVVGKSHGGSQYGSKGNSQVGSKVASAGAVFGSGSKNGGRGSGSLGGAVAGVGVGSKAIGSAGGKSAAVSATAFQMSSVNWGHEPQYLHNVRKIVTDGLGEVSTIAGSIIRK